MQRIHTTTLHLSLYSLFTCTAGCRSTGKSAQSKNMARAAPLPTGASRPGRIDIGTEFVYNKTIKEGRRRQTVAPPVLVKRSNRSPWWGDGYFFFAWRTRPMMPMITRQNWYSSDVTIASPPSETKEERRSLLRRMGSTPNHPRRKRNRLSLS